MIDRSGEWSRGTEFADLTTYIAEYTGALGEPADRVLQASCTCGASTFGLAVDDAQGCARRTCASCGTTAFVADSDEYWDEAEPGEAACPCGGETFEIGVGFTLHDEREVRWVTVGGRCIACGSSVCTRTGASTTHRPSTC